MVGIDHTGVVEKPHGGGEMDSYRGETIQLQFICLGVYKIIGWVYHAIMVWNHMVNLFNVFGSL